MRWCRHYGAFIHTKLRVLANSSGLVAAHKLVLVHRTGAAPTLGRPRLAGGLVYAYTIFSFAQSAMWDSSRSRRQPAC
jgi:hypothetical protein